MAEGLFSLDVVVKTTRPLIAVHRERHHHYFFTRRTRERAEEGGTAN